MIDALPQQLRSEPSADRALRRVNPLIAAAEPLLLAIALLAQEQDPQSLAQLQSKLLQAIDDFDADATAHGITEEHLDHARYALCALLDETILASPWGAGSWAKYSLLATYYDEGYAGEAFFERLTRIGEQRESGVALLEFFHLCLSLGYSGRFHTRRQTEEGIQRLREQVATLSWQFRRSPPALSPSTNLTQVQPQRGPRLPLWVLASVTGAIILMVYQGLDWYLSGSAEPILTQLQSLSRTG